MELGGWYRLRFLENGIGEMVCRSILSRTIFFIFFKISVASHLQDPFAELSDWNRLKLQPDAFIDTAEEFCDGKFFFYSLFSIFRDDVKDDPKSEK